MPELWLAFDRPVPFDDYIDLRSLHDATVDALTDALGLPRLWSFVGVGREAWDEIEAHLVASGIKPAAEPWSPDRRPWFAAEAGIDWCERLSRHLGAIANPFPPEADNRPFVVVEELATLLGKLRMAQPLGARWGLLAGA
jgi:hypothetical protein